MPANLTPERKTLLAQLVKDEWPLRQIRSTHGFGPDTVKRHHPGYVGMDLSEAGKLGMKTKRTNAAIRRRHAGL